MASSALSIVILNYNTRDLVVECIQSTQKYAPDSQLVVVDNASIDQSAAVVRQRFPSVTLIQNETNVGFARAMNQSVRATTGRAVLLLNADTALLLNTIPSLLRALDELPRAGILGPLQYLPDSHRVGRPGIRIASAFQDPTLVREVCRLFFFTDSIAVRLRRGPWRAVSPSAPQPVDWLMGAALLFRRECWDAVGGFDESQFMYGEDWDICYRARKLGWQVYLVPHAQILHHANAAGVQQFGANRWARVLAANLFLHEKHFGRTSRRLLAFANVIGAGLRLFLLLPIRFIKKSDLTVRMRWQAQVALACTALSGMHS